MKQKRCTKCAIRKPLQEYYAYSKARDGRMSQCKECIKASERERYRVNWSEIKLRRIQKRA